MDGLSFQNVLARKRICRTVFKGGFMNDNTLIFNYLCFQNDYAFILNTVANVDEVGHWVAFYKLVNVLYFFDSLGKKPSFYNGTIARFYKLYNGAQKDCDKTHHTI